MTKTLSREEILPLIPHGNGMCMLDSVVEWNENQIVCTSNRLNDVSNPLCDGGQLKSILLIEYAAQAAAVHAGLLRSNMGKQRPAYIGAIKNLDVFVASVQDHSALRIQATCEMQSDSGAIYQFSVSQSATEIICGKLILSQPTS